MADEKKRGIPRYLAEYGIVAGLAVGSYLGFQNMQADHNPAETGPARTLGHAVMENVRLIPGVADAQGHDNNLENNVKLAFSDLAAGASIFGYILGRVRH